MIQAPSPSVAGTFAAQPLGFLLHGSRSGQNWTESEEFWATVRYAQSGANGLGWHVTAMAGKVAVHLTPRQWAWNARSPASQTYIACEFAQPGLGDPISDAAVDAFCHYVRMDVLPVWPNIPRFCLNHSELPAGIADGKTDAYPIGMEADAFNARMLARLNLMLDNVA